MLEDSQLITGEADPFRKGICRDWALSVGDNVFGSAPGEVAAGGVADPLRRGQIEVDVSGAGFDAELADLAAGDTAILLVGLEMLYA